SACQKTFDTLRETAKKEFRSRNSQPKAILSYAEAEKPANFRHKIKETDVFSSVSSCRFLYKKSVENGLDLY
ncbi:MAG: hypothetical protein IJL59_06225, partial [Clostridia bacterium]|nr:hypothetical protein [Clostridia bacterium]